MCAAVGEAAAAATTLHIHDLHALAAVLLRLHAHALVCQMPLCCRLVGEAPLQGGQCCILGLAAHHVQQEQLLVRVDGGHALPRGAEVRLRAVAQLQRHGQADHAQRPLQQVCTLRVLQWQAAAGQQACERELGSEGRHGVAHLRRKSLVALRQEARFHGENGNAQLPVALGHALEPLHHRLRVRGRGRTLAAAGHGGRLVLHGLQLAQDVHDHALKRLGALVQRTHLLRLRRPASWGRRRRRPRGVARGRRVMRCAGPGRGRGGALRH
mmetsp:Transcript_38707/g.97485  ORF Transcript_38707/g.97485 Transcript_38707/m.97485 type:complete len:269 (+) Transcript_38707:168-974(+)